VLDFLRKYGYPIPEELTPERPRVAVLLDATSSKPVLDSLEGTFEVLHHSDALDGLLRIGAQPPDAVVLGAKVGRLSGAEIIAALKRRPRTQHIRAVLFSSRDSDRQEALDAGASAQVNASDVQGLKDTLEALVGLRR
jgi:CheY-like chemotaxis protein